MSSLIFNQHRDSCSRCSHSHSFAFPQCFSHTLYLKSSAGTNGESMIFEKICFSPKARSTLFWHPVFCNVFRILELVSQGGPGASRGRPRVSRGRLGASRGKSQEPLGRLRGRQNVLEIGSAPNSKTKIHFGKTYESIAYATVF